MHQGNIRHILFPETDDLMARSAILIPESMEGHLHYLSTIHPPSTSEDPRTSVSHHNLAASQFIVSSSN